MVISAENRAVLKLSLTLLMRINKDILEAENITSYTKEMLENELKMAKRAMEDIKTWDTKKG